MPLHTCAWGGLCCWESQPSPLHWLCQPGLRTCDGTTCVLEAPDPCLWPPCLSQTPPAIHSLTEYSQTPPWARPCANLLGSLILQLVVWTFPFGHLLRFVSAFLI